MLLGRETKLFPLRFKRSKEDRQPMSLGIEERLQSPRCKYLKDCRPNKEGNNTPIETGLLGRESNKYEGNPMPLRGGIIGRENDKVHDGPIGSRLFGRE